MTATWKTLGNERGIVLVTSLMLTLITLVVTMALLYTITAGTTASGKLTQYRTTVDAAYGGAEIVSKDVIPFLLANYSSATLVSKLTGSSGFQGVNLSLVTTQACLQAKLKKGTANWPAGCYSATSAAVSPDLTMQLPSTGGTPITVYSKILSTKAGNSDMGGISLIGGGVSDPGNNVIYPLSQPFLYTIEVQGQRQGDTKIGADLEILYAY